MTDEEKIKYAKNLLSSLKGNEQVNICIGNQQNNLYSCGGNVYYDKPDKENAAPSETAQESAEKSSATCSSKKASSVGRKQEGLFQFQENGKNEEMTERKAKEFIDFLKIHHWSSKKLDTKKDSCINQAFLAFFDRWQKEGLIVKSFSNGRAVFRFLNEDCGISTDVTKETFANAMRLWLQDNMANEEMILRVDDFYEQST